MAYSVMRPGDMAWRRSNQMGVLNTDLGRAMGAGSLGARLWRIEPGQASTKHRHRLTEEIYVVLEGTGRMRLGDEVLTLEPGCVVVVGPETVRQPFNDTEADALWLVVGAPNEAANSLEMTPEDLAFIYPDGPRALPPELGGGEQPPWR